MKLVVRDQGGSSSPMRTSSKWTMALILRLPLPLVADAGGDAAAHELPRLVRPLDLVVRVEHQAEPSLALIEVLQPRSAGDDVARTHGHAVGICLSAVDAGQPDALDSGNGRRRPRAVHRPGEGVEVAWRDDPAPARGLGVVFVPVERRRRLRPIGGDRPFADVGERDRGRMARLAPSALGLFHRRTDQRLDALRHRLLPNRYLALAYSAAADPGVGWMGRPVSASSAAAKSGAASAARISACRLESNR